MSNRSPFYWTSSACTDAGAVRELNEDAYLERPDLGLWLVADGMGGHFAGNVASQMVVSAMVALEPSATLSEFVEAVEQRLVETNTRLREYAEHEQVQAIGSTVVTLLLCGEYAVCLWAGDSRLYRYRGDGLEQISHDHALVEELLEHGVLTPEQAVDHPHANLVTRAVGASERLSLDTEIIPIQAGDLFILCSDGLEKELLEEEISVMAEEGDASQLSHALLERALVNGAHDNVTVITVAIHGRPGNARGSDETDGSGEADGEKDADAARNEQQPPT